MTAHIMSNIGAWIPLLILVAILFGLAWANLYHSKPRIGSHYADLQRKALRRMKGKRL